MCIKKFTQFVKGDNDLRSQRSSKNLVTNTVGLRWQFIKHVNSLLSMEPWAATKTLASMAVLPAPVRVPSHCSLAPSVTCVSPVN